EPYRRKSGDQQNTAGVLELLFVSVCQCKHEQHFSHPPSAHYLKPFPQHGKEMGAQVRLPKASLALCGKSVLTSALSSLSSQPVENVDMMLENFLQSMAALEGTNLSNKSYPSIQHIYQCVICGLSLQRVTGEADDKRQFEKPYRDAMLWEGEQQDSATLKMLHHKKGEQRRVPSSLHHLGKLDSEQNQQ
ncbi:hypothetical protein STEG23_005680, partial [Scotinomys teguina]